MHHDKGFGKSLLLEDRGKRTSLGASDLFGEKIDGGEEEEERMVVEAPRVSMAITADSAGYRQLCVVRRIFDGGLLIAVPVIDDFSS